MTQISILEKVIQDRGDMIFSFDMIHKHKFVVAGLQVGGYNPIRLVGCVVQVRKEQGQFGSDIVFLRHSDGDLWTHENQMFWLVKEKYEEELMELFKDHISSDLDNETYTINNKQEASGFIIPSPYKEGDHTPMRDIKQKINDLLK